ncbi:rhomboid family intramembrane serine protease [Cytobacillus suaedae]|nr:rhomboid family intramembrane serine protease [Cytobacillus suaedae]
MVFRQDYTFWKLTRTLVLEKEYRILQISTNAQEIWLESSERELPKLVRILRYDLDWGNWMQRDMETTLQKVRNISKRLGFKKLDVANIYVSTYPPVDDWQHRLEEPLHIKENRTHINMKTFVLHADIAKEDSRLQLLADFSIEDFKDTPGPLIDTSGIEELRREVLKETQRRIKNEQRIFQYSKPFFTYVFIALQVLMFLLLELRGGSTNIDTLLAFGAKENTLILNGEWWRFFTPIILHIGIFHLLMNTLALYFLGSAVERIFGRTRFLILYIFAGFAGSLGSFLFSSSVSAGASGAIFGLFGALLFFGLSYPKLFFRTMGTNIITIILINLAFGFIVPGIDNAGHIGGLIGGFLASGIVSLPGRKLYKNSVIYFTVTVLLTVSLLIIGFRM